MRALVTGSAGFVGRHLCPKLWKVGYDVTEVDYHKHNSISSILVRDWERETFHVIVHLAANIVNVDKRMKMGLAAYDDIELDLNFCKCVQAQPPVKALVLMSSCAVDYPDDPYCIVKRNLESFAKTLAKQGVPTIVLRPFSGYGEDQSEEYPFRAILERALRKEDPLTFWGGSQVRDWVHIDDLTDAIMFAINNESVPRDATPIEVGTEIGTPIDALAFGMARSVGYEPRFQSLSKETSSSRRVAGENGMRTLQEFGWFNKIGLVEGINRAVAVRAVTA